MIDVSVIVPVLDAGSYIRDCITSLIGQDFSKDQYEIIVVDNGSTDGTLNILAEYRDYISILHEAKKGSYSARNIGINLSKGEIIAFTDADCIVDRNWLKELFKGFESSKDIGCVVGKIVAYPGKTLIEKFSKNQNILSQDTTLKSKFLPYGQTANAAFRKKVFEEIGNFDDTIGSGGDADIAWRMQLLTKYRLVYYPEAVVQHRHRTTTRKLFVQYFNYGIGNVILFKKYNKSMKYEAGASLSEWIKAILTGILSSIVKIAKNPSKYSMLEPFLLLTFTVALRIGRIYGSYKFKSFYI